MKINTRNYLNYFVTGMLCLAIIFSTACGNKLVRGASPMVRMSELSHQDGMIELKLNIRNINGVDMTVQNIDFKLSMNNAESLSYNSQASISIVANGIETWTVELPETVAVRQLLNSLENDEIKSLPYTLTGSVGTMEDGSLRYQYEGHIYPLPGRPGHFR